MSIRTWGFTLAVIVLSVWMGRQVSSRLVDEPLWFQGSAQPGTSFVWRTSSPDEAFLLLGHDITAARLRATYFGFSVWNGAFLTADLRGEPAAADACLAQARRFVQGTQERDRWDGHSLSHLRGNHLAISANRPIDLVIDPPNTSAGEVHYDFGGQTHLAYYKVSRHVLTPGLPDSVASRVAALNPPLHPYGKIRGTEGDSFRIAQQIDAVGKDCRGVFRPFTGGYYPTFPPEYIGEASSGVLRLSTTSRWKDVEGVRSSINLSLGLLGERGGDELEGVEVRAMGDPTLLLKVPVEAVRSTGMGRAQLNYAGKVYLVMESMPVEVEFADTAPGHLTLSSGEEPAQLTGVPIQLRLNGKDLRPRKIEKWPWHVQMVASIVLALLVEHAGIAWIRALTGARPPSTASAQSAPEPTPAPAPAADDAVPVELDYLRPLLAARHRAWQWKLLPLVRRIPNGYSMTPEAFAEWANAEHGMHLDARDVLEMKHELSLLLDAPPSMLPVHRIARQADRPDALWFHFPPRDGELVS